MMKNSLHIDRKTSDHMKLIHVIELLSKHVENESYCIEKHVVESALSYMIELQIIKSKELVT
jgi:hypothetical protein